MNLLQSKSTVECELATTGYVLVNYPDQEKAVELITALGKVIHEIEITENPKATRLLFTNQSMSFHTDHYAAKFVANYCHQKSVLGGECLLMDTRQVFKLLSTSELLMLKDITVKTNPVFYGDKLSIPLLSSIDYKHSSDIYYAPWLVDIPDSFLHREALRAFEEAIKSVEPVQILLNPGDLLITDNHRMMHGRNGFPADSKRWHTRYWIQ